MAFWNREKPALDSSYEEWIKQREEAEYKAKKVREEIERRRMEREMYEKMFPPVYIPISSTYSTSDAKFCGVTLEAVLAMKELFAELELLPTAANVEVLREFIKESKP